MSAPAIAWIVETLIATTLLMGLVMALRGPVRQAFGPQAAYLLWIIPALRMVLPPDLLPRLMPHAPDPIAPIADAGTVILLVDVPAAGARTSELGWPALGLAIAGCWMVGGAAFLLWHYWGFARLKARILSGATETGRHGGVRIVEARSGEGPLAFGILRRYVVLPADFRANYDHDEQRLALAHELAHHQRGDLIANLAAFAMLAVHWFNPVAWFAFRAFRADQEMACDARVLAADRSGAHAYGLAIVKSARGGAVSPACHLHTITQIKERLKMLNKPRTPFRRALGAMAAIGVATVAIAATAPGTRANAALEEASDKVATALAPLPPLPPLAPAVQDAPPAPPALREPVEPPEPPVAPEAPEAHADMPPLPPLPPEPPEVQRKRVKVVTRNGATPFVKIDDVPEVSSINCDVDGNRRFSGDEMTMVRHRDGKKMVIICTDRIERHAAAAAREAADARKIGRQAMRTAMASLDSSRAQIAADRGMREADRAEALADLDEARRELEAEMADMEAELRDAH